MGKPVINEKIDERWVNWHRSINVGGRAGKILQPLNKYESGAPPPGKEFLAGLDGLIEIVKEAASRLKKVRAHGSGWSLNDIAFTKEFLVDSNRLGYIKVGLPFDQVTDNYKNKAHLLVFAQCGVMVQNLNLALQEKKLALPTCGASDGQRIVGAIATGTHGSAHTVGAMTEYVRGMHIVVQGRHVFLQRDSDQVATSEFGKWINDAEIINDDDLFNAALVGFGAFGLIHALLIETEPQYYLERVIRNYHLSEVRDAITKWDLSGLNLPQGNVMPFHFECVINPYPIDANEKAAFVRVFYRHDVLPASLADEGPPSDTPDIHTAMGLQADEIQGELLEKAEKDEQDVGLDSTGPSRDRLKVIGFLTQVALKISFPTKTPEQPIRVPGKWFHGPNSSLPHTKAPIPGTSLELGVPFNRVGDALDLVLDVVNKHPFAAPLALRYVKKSTATLGFTGLADITVTMEMPGPFGLILFNRTGEAHQKLFEALEASNIPHSYHWGQQFPQNPKWVRKTYGDAAVDQWKTQRKKLLGDAGIKMFSNILMEEIGLADMTKAGFMAGLWRMLLNLIFFRNRRPEV